MADQYIGSLDPAESIEAADLFVMEQGGHAKKLRGDQLTDFVNREIEHITIETLDPDQPARVMSYDTTTHTIVLGLPRGASIDNIRKTSTSGIVDTYTITFEEYYGGSVSPPVTFQITNGRGIDNIEKTSGTHTPGTLDTYTITYNDNTTYTFQVYNGQDGLGSPGTSTPLMDGTAAVGTANAYSRQDHVHPSDTSRVPTTRTVNGISLDGDITTRLFFENVSANSWTELSSSAPDYNEDFPWRGTLSCSGVTASMVPEVIFKIEDATSGDYSPIAKSDTNKIYIYAANMPTATITVPTVIAWK